MPGSGGASFYTIPCRLALPHLTVFDLWFQPMWQGGALYAAGERTVGRGAGVTDTAQAWGLGLESQPYVMGLRSGGFAQRMEVLGNASLALLFFPGLRPRATAAWGTGAGPEGPSVHLHRALSRARHTALRTSQLEPVFSQHPFKVGPFISPTTGVCLQCVCVWGGYAAEP